MPSPRTLDIMASTGWDWVFHALGWTIAGLGLLLALWALFWDRSRGRKRCPKCWYSMEGAVTGANGGFTCPECGTTIRSPRALLKTRRRPLWVGLGVVAGLASYPVFAIPAVREGGWRRAVPSSVLVFIVPVGENAWKPSTLDIFPFGGPRSPLLKELLRREEEHKLSTWQSRVVLDRYFDANAIAREMLVQTRSRWPAGHVVTAYVAGPWHFGYMSDDVIMRVRPDIPGAPWAEYGMIISSSFIGTAPQETGEVAIEYELLIGAVVLNNPDDGSRSVDYSKAVRMWSGTTSSIRVVETAEEAMTPVADDVTGETMSRYLQPALRQNRDGRVVLALGSDSAHPTNRNLDWALGLRVEIHYSGEVVATGSVLYRLMPPHIVGWWQGWRSGEPYPGVWSEYDLQWRIDPPTPADVVDGGWTIRLVSDADIAVLDYRRESYWVGEIEVEVFEFNDSPFGRPG